MNKRFYTVGIAGHIDHGKTTLTKALTDIDTDRLKEEKERQISIELGFAPLYEEEDLQLSIVDVPGHERFIRRMIAGVAGIDLMLLVVASDEGIMPQTREHLDILTLLGIKKGIVVLTKASKVDEGLRELAKAEIQEELIGSPFEGAPILMVDSLSGEGVDELRHTILHHVKEVPVKGTEGDFRLPIDQVFTVKGQGTIARGTIYEGMVMTGTDVRILPEGITAKARQIQVHGMATTQGSAGQRTAINLAGVNYQDVKRGSVLVSSSHFTVTDTIDISLDLLRGSRLGLKQRMEVTFHTGTSEVIGKLIFFDRNHVEGMEKSILCQIRLSEEIVVKRGDRFIIRRPTPSETLGGGWVINPNGEKYKFGNDTILKLRSIMEGAPEDRILELLQNKKSLSEKSILNEASISEHELTEILKEPGWIILRGSEVTHESIVEDCGNSITRAIRAYHEENSLEKGINSGHLTTLLRTYPDSVIQVSIETLLQKNVISKESGILSMDGFVPRIPKQWEKRCMQIHRALLEDGLHVNKMEEYFESAGIPASLREDFYRFFIQEKWVTPLDDKYAYAHESYTRAVSMLRERTGSQFSIAQAKDILDLSRKYMIPFLERLDKEGYTVRIDEKRKWISTKE
ncbi:selenocysteine-specific translation elongation factor [Rossellomorea aquimaris]|uniref:selenocysteine-specific translation elongation factor n=1 Tax=Rossellomorea aquimaris TaxID=189382 RepID=UPI001CD3B1AE|nr:selenocysteine-specific translation elongation factor [Rossellomorea aquimaris]MCA1053661.1 selenocysteine-specific translation elongation factor [Rossellomorea aquimaris]